MVLRFNFIFYYSFIVLKLLNIFLTILKYILCGPQQYIRQKANVYHALDKMKNVQDNDVAGQMQDTSVTGSECI